MRIDTIAIVAAHSRPYVMAASAAGYHVLAADIFGDVETQAISRHQVVLPYADGSFEADGIRNVFMPSLKQAGVDAVLYGSGFEAQAHLLDEIHAEVPVLGNGAATVNRCKDPFTFQSIADKGGIRTPQIHACRKAIPLDETTHWLRKQIGGSGGMHIYPAGSGPANLVDGHYYYQQRLVGVPVSLLFLAWPDGTVDNVGFHRQFVAPSPALPYRYGGLVSGLELPVHLRSNMLAAAAYLAKALNLVGLNSLDMLVSDGEWYALEINPRLSASLGLYADAPYWLAAHMAACRHQPRDGQWVPSPARQAVANLVCYSPRRWHVPIGFNWPSWVVDRPASAVVDADAPLCTIIASAEMPDAAETLARARMRELLALIEKGVLAAQA